VTRPTREMRRAIAEAVVGDDVFGDDPTAIELERLAAEITGREAALFVPSGSMGNEVSVMAHTRRGDEAIVETDSHIYNYEAAGPAVLAGVQLAPVRGEMGIFTLEQVEQAIRPDDPHEAVTRLICLENTHNRAGGVVYPLDMMRDIYGLAVDRGLKVHLDGARIFNAAMASGIDVKEYCSYCDSMMFCLSKGLGAPIGSVVVGDRDFIHRAHRNRKLLGGGMRQAGIIGNSLDAKVVMRAAGRTYELLRRHEADLRYIFIVSQVTIIEDPDAKDGLEMEILKADGHKCERCWNYSVEVGIDKLFPTLCERCIPAIKEITNYE